MAQSCAISRDLSVPVITKSLYSFVSIGQTQESFSPVDIREIIEVNPYGVTPLLRIHEL